MTEVTESEVGLSALRKQIAELIPIVDVQKASLAEAKDRFERIDALLQGIEAEASTPERKAQYLSDIRVIINQAMGR